MADKIESSEVANYYNRVKSVWPDSELWYQHTRDEIPRFINKHPFNVNDYVLNAGCGDKDYDIKGMVHYVDIAESKIKDKPKHTVANIENLPFESNSFDGVICVGSVLNYCDAIAAISELSRVLRPKGRLILEFESSNSYEYLNTPAYSADAHIVMTTYQGEPHKIWVYSPQYIKNIIKQSALVICKEHFFHVFSELAFHCGESEEEAARFARFDSISTLVPFVKKHGCNLILLCEKKSFLVDPQSKI